MKKLMGHGAATNSIELSGDTKAFDRVARKWNVDYAFYKTGPDKYLLFFKSGQADAITACFSEYSRKVLNKSKSRRIPIREQLKQAADQLAKEKPRKRERVKEAVREGQITSKNMYSPTSPICLCCGPCLKLGTAYRLAAGADFAHKLMGLGQTIGPGLCRLCAGAQSL